ncbi:hypothetical protein [Emticicia sp. 21SJ11W-3]|uniref:hypothetical protein n=1 Tax=Emticicia sp. 21SJ11W-3 TaxID=2916755 RepID=UPI00209F0713|nr:hypothetical protein [Emticicia sp. 21SJ11W-3]UTA68522.1 hypothetical protein MB380_01645 [Emticicia sp. 21SJ11W-3]
MKKLMVIMLVALATACSKETAEPQANLGGKIEMSYAQAVMLQEGVSVKVTKIEDSRCPKNVVCVWAGMVKVYFSVTENNVTKDASVELYADNSKTPRTTVILNGTTYAIEVTEVSPYPSTPDPISLENYRIIFTIKKV